MELRTFLFIMDEKPTDNEIAENEGSPIEITDELGRGANFKTAAHKEYTIKEEPISPTEFLEHSKEEQLKTVSEHVPTLDELPGKELDEAAKKNVEGLMEGNEEEKNPIQDSFTPAQKAYLAGILDRLRAPNGTNIVDILDDSRHTPDGMMPVMDAIQCDLIAIEDSKEKGVLGYLTQRMTRANYRTKHGFVYEPEPLDNAIADSEERVVAGAMLSEKHHPQLILDAQDKNGRGPKFVFNWNNVTARVVKIFNRAADGWVDVKRAILDTADGRLVWAAAKSGKPWALSVRWFCDSEAGRTGKPKNLTLVTVDDVEIPAMDGAGQLLALVDSFEEHGVDTMTDLTPEGENGLGEPFYGINRNTVNPHPVSNKADAEVEKIANEDSSSLTDSAQNSAKVSTMTTQEILKAVRQFTAIAARKGANRNEIEVAIRGASKAIADAFQEGLPVADYVKPFQSAYCKLAVSDEECAYHPGVRGPYIELGNMIDFSPGEGWAPDLRDVPQDNLRSQERQIQQNTDKKVHDINLVAQDEADKKKEDEKMDEEVEAKMDSIAISDARFAMLDSDTKTSIRREVKRRAKTVDEVQGVADSLIKMATTAFGANDKLRAMGYTNNVPNGRTNDPASPMSHVNVAEPRPGQGALEKLLNITDEMLKMGPMIANTPAVNPSDPNVKVLRAYNMAQMAPLMDHWENRQIEAVGKDVYFKAITDSSDVDAIITGEANKVGRAISDSYTTALSSVPNQPTIWKWLLTQAFQDQKALAFILAVGPGQASTSGPGWEDRTGFGRIFRMPYETYVDPSGAGFEYGGLDFSLIQTENSGITEGGAQLYWDTFYPYWRMNATSSTIQSIKSIGNGPLNYALGARNIWHMLARKSRAVDKAGFDEMGRIALEYGAVAVANETYTAGNNGLANQTCYQNGSTTVPGAISTSVVVNLNPTKTAKSAVVIATDDYACYPVPNVTPGAGGLLPIAAVRLLSGAAVGVNSGTYFGTNGLSKNPVCPARNNLNITSTGFDTTTVSTPITVTAPANQIQGYLGSDGYIYTAPAQQILGQTATWALDPMNGVVVFASGVVNNAGAVGTTITMGAYSYSTNFDPFPLTPGLNGMAGLATGEKPVEFMNRLLAQFDYSAGNMSSWPRFVAPDLAIMSATVSPNITMATAFYKLNSPRDTELYPSEEFFATRNGIDLARINTPWFIGDTAILLTRRYSTKYAIDTPAEVRGPVIKYDSSGNFMAGEGYYLAENSAIFTPQVKNPAGTIINPVARLLLLIQGGKISTGIPY